jgi:hypothetical protein
MNTAKLVNLSGCWQLLSDSSDFVPGLEYVHSHIQTPICWAALFKPGPTAEQECLFIEQRKTDYKEEFSVTCRLAPGRRVRYV